ncbi:uncharacterized protein MYCFIDRAFT_176732 [Pseudocercospora fijiensis CIRAD86]|uniref:Uncharacterized protein n=1 Tax=Pseudocercospora fijiensis (strain CIRAD86) TaxID=383855 RepID=M3AA00_PSEFD|nr:uncharacterized protein MYCFIDRAFT_176732 [Pseudocercospora fijiensis CIRAD86]EME81456.1 hypothetical protein MYCFIDRAFT_176732 [Pseudocercospora fijiensis CIRAD86]
MCDCRSAELLVRRRGLRFPHADVTISHAFHVRLRFPLGTLNCSNLLRAIATCDDCWATAVADELRKLHQVSLQLSGEAGNGNGQLDGSNSRAAFGILLDHSNYPDKLEFHYEGLK